MAFKGKTTAGYKPTTGRQLSGAKKGGKISPNPRKPLPKSTTNVVTKASMQGVNPRNSRSNKLASNRIQRAAGQTGMKQNMPAAKIITPRAKMNPNVKPFSGYSLLSNSRQVPAGKGNLRNAGNIRTDLVKQRSAGAAGTPKAAVSRGKGFKGFIGGK